MAKKVSLQELQALTLNDIDRINQEVIQAGNWGLSSSWTNALATAKQDYQRSDRLAQFSGLLKNIIDVSEADDTDPFATSNAIEALFNDAENL